MYVSPARICFLYYEEGLTQAQIAKQLGISRIRVSRMLAAARKDGVVRITIRYDGFDPDLEAALQRSLGIARVVVAESVAREPEENQRIVAATAAEYVRNLAHSVSSIAVGWGTTMRLVADSVEPEDAGPTVLPLIGGQGPAPLDIHATTIAHHLAKALSGESVSLLAPAIARSLDERDSLMRQPDVAGTLSRAAGADAAVFSLGNPLAPTSTLALTNYFADHDIALLRSEGAECDVISTLYLDHDGAPCAEALAARAVAIGVPELRGIPQKICVVSGQDKANAVQLAARHHLIDCLFIDSSTATHILREEQGNG